MAIRKSDEAYAQLRRRIMAAEIRPGAPIEERALQEDLGVGRTPLREAVLRLEQEGLVRSRGRGGYFVTETSTTDLVRAFELRREIECFAAACAAERRNADDLAGFEDYLARMAAEMEARSGDVAWNLAADEEFHHLVARASDNRFSVEYLAHLYGISVRSLYLSRVPVTLVLDEIGHYRAVLGAIAMRDGNAARAAMAAHLTISPVQAILDESGVLPRRTAR